jgi:NAD(P)H-dependent FMN reductase
MPVYDKGFRLVGLSGSIRKGSINTIILRTLAERSDDGVSLTVLPLDDVPLYNRTLRESACRTRCEHSRARSRKATASYSAHRNTITASPVC